MFKICVKKGTLIIIDVNTKDYLGRAEVPEHFATKNRLKVNSLVTLTQN